MPDIFEPPFVFTDPKSGAAVELSGSDWLGPSYRTLGQVFPETLNSMVRAAAYTPPPPTPTILYGSTFQFGPTLGPMLMGREYPPDTPRRVARGSANRFAEWFLGRMAYEQPELYKQLVQTTFRGLPIVWSGEPRLAPAGGGEFFTEGPHPINASPRPTGSLPWLLERRLGSIYDPFPMLARATRPKSEGRAFTLDKPGSVGQAAPLEKASERMMYGQMWPMRGVPLNRGGVPRVTSTHRQGGRQFHYAAMPGDYEATWFGRTGPTRPASSRRLAALLENPTNRRIQQFLRANLGKSSGFYGGAKIGTLAKGAGIAGLALLGLQLLRGNED